MDKYRSGSFKAIENVLMIMFPEVLLYISQRIIYIANCNNKLLVLGLGQGRDGEITWTWATRIFEKPINSNFKTLKNNMLGRIKKSMCKYSYK